MSPATAPTKKAGKPIAEMEPEELVKLYDDNPNIRPVSGAYRYSGGDGEDGTLTCMCPMTLLAVCRIAHEDQIGVPKAIEVINAAAGAKVGYPEIVSSALGEDERVIGAFARGFDGKERQLRHPGDSDELYEAIKAAYLLGDRVRARLRGRTVISWTY